jgi:hypothetical protein
VRVKSITRAIRWGGGVGHENLDFFAPDGTRFARCHCRAQKSFDFQGPPIPVVLVGNFARIKIITSRAI